MVRIQDSRFDPHAEVAAWAKGRTEAGALATFVGSVRGSDGAGPVLALELEHYGGYTEAEIARIETDCRARFELIDSLIIHRYGRMFPGEAIVLVACLSTHRREALSAVDYLMDRLKTEAPFWKKQVGPEGSEWIEPREDDLRSRRRWEEDLK